MAPRKSGGGTPGEALRRRGRSGGPAVGSDDDEAPQAGGLQPVTQGNNIRSASPPSRSPQHGAHGRASLGGAGPAGGTPPPVTLLAEQPLSERIKSLRTRTRSTLLMVAGYIAVLYAGHVVVCMFIVCVQAAIVSELFILAAQKNIEKGLPGFRSQQWYFFVCAAVFVYGRLLKNNFLMEVAENPGLPGIIGWSVRHHTFVSYALYTIGFLLFVTGLKKQTLLYQFGQFAWTHMILLIVLGQSSFFAANIMEGLIWFVLPSHLVIINDIMAYLFGFFFGRTPLIKLSPKKTWEGFLGALVTTLAVSWHLSRYLAQYQWLVCPRKDLTIRTWVHCEPANTFKALPAAETLDPLPAPLRNFVLRRLSPDATLLPLQLHALAFAFFAAVIAPFGGFFASGFKRALRVKDFGATIPGHGGITDRMDCQLVMAVFSYIYIEGIVGLGDVSVSLLVEKAQRLSTADKLELYKLLGQMLGKPYQ